MNPLEQELRERTKVDSYVGAKIETIEEGKTLMAEVEEHSKILFREMVEKDLTNVEQQCYSDVRYDLKTARQRIGSQLTSLVKQKMKNRKPTL